MRRRRLLSCDLRNGPAPRRAPPSAAWLLRLLVAITATVAGPARAAPPAVYSVSPGKMNLSFIKYDGTIQHTITGAHFDREGFEVWVWTPDADDLQSALLRLGRPSATIDTAAVGDLLKVDTELLQPDPATPDPAAVPVGQLPAEPPMEAMHRPQGAARRLADSGILHRAADRLVLSLPRGHAVWLRNRDGWSRPFLLNQAQGFYVAPTRVRPQDHIRVVGLDVGGSVGLRDGRRAWVLPAMVAAREGWGGDPFVRYARLPADADEGTYEVFVHSGSGGVCGWTRVGQIEIAAGGAQAPPVLARDHGVVGDGLTDDTVALERALAHAAPGTEVRLPFGVFRVTRTLALPPGVRLAGAGGSVLRGDGFEPTQGREPGPVVRLASGTGLEQLVVEGAVPNGDPPGPRALVALQPGAEDVTLLNCRFTAAREAPADFAPAYAYALSGSGCRRVRLAHSEIDGAIAFRDVEQLELVRNRIYEANHEGVALDVTGRHCLIDCNMFRLAPGRLKLHPLVRSVVRYNQLSRVWRGEWVTATEDEGPPPAETPRRLAMASGGTPVSLVDARASWSTDAWRHAVVLIVEGRGFGQARLVTGNTADSLTVDPAWTVPPDATSRYLVGPLSLETVFSYNYHDAIAPWIVRDSVGCLFRAHYMAGAPRFEFRGEDRTSAEQPHAFHPCWQNVLVGGFIESCAALVTGHVKAGSLLTAPPTFGNVLVASQFFDAPPARLAHGFAPRTVSVELAAAGGVQAGRAAVEATVVGGAAEWTDVGVAIGPGVRWTTIPGLQCSRTPLPVEHRGDGLFQGRVILGAMEFDPKTRRHRLATDTWPEPGQW